MHEWVDDALSTPKDKENGRELLSLLLSIEPKFVVPDEDREYWHDSLARVIRESRLADIPPWAYLQQILDFHKINEERNLVECRVIFDGFDYSSAINFYNENTYPIYVWTYTLADVRKLYGTIPQKFWGKVQVIVNSETAEPQASTLFELTNGEVKVRFDNKTHRKIVLHSTDKVMMGSANFGHSLNKESMMEITSQTAYDFLAKKFHLIWDSLEDYNPQRVEEDQPRNSPRTRYSPSPGTRKEEFGDG